MHIRQPSDHFQFLPAPHTQKPRYFSIFPWIEKVFFERLKIPVEKIYIIGSNYFIVFRKNY